MQLLLVGTTLVHVAGVAFRAASDSLVAHNRISGGREAGRGRERKGMGDGGRQGGWEGMKG